MCRLFRRAVNLDTDFILFIKNNSTWIIGLNTKDKAIKFLRKTERNLHDLW